VITTSLETDVYDMLVEVRSRVVPMIAQTQGVEMIDPDRNLVLRRLEGLIRRIEDAREVDLWD
jgi:hypothetical protein